MAFSHPLPHKALEHFENLVAARKTQITTMTNSTNSTATVAPQMSNVSESSVPPASSSLLRSPASNSSVYGVMKRNATGKKFLATSNNCHTKVLTKFFLYATVKRPNVRTTMDSTWKWFFKMTQSNDCGTVISSLGSFYFNLERIFLFCRASTSWGSRKQTVHSVVWTTQLQTIPMVEKSCLLP